MKDDHPIYEAFRAASDQSRSVEIETSGGGVYKGRIVLFCKRADPPTVSLKEQRPAGGAYINIDTVLRVDEIAAVRVLAAK